MRRRELRELILQTLFQIDFTNANPTEVFEYLNEEHNLNDKEFLFIKNKVEGTLSNITEIDKEISKYLKDWNFNRLPRVDRSILRMSVYEIIYEKDISYKIVLNEAIELAKDYSTDESAKFINGVLGAFVKGNKLGSEDELN